MLVSSRATNILLVLILAVGVAIVAMLATGVRGGPLDPQGTPGPTDSVKLPGTPISGPTNITVPGHYYLTRNIAVSGLVSGVLVSANDVSLDLGGFTISGNDTVSTYGILVGAVSRVEIRNGHIRDFNFGLDAGAATEVVIDGVHVSSNGRGITLGSYNDLSQCTAMNNSETGIYVPSSYSVVRECTVEQNGGDGITVAGYFNTVERSQFHANQQQDLRDTVGYTAFREDDSTKTTLKVDGYSRVIDMVCFNWILNPTNNFISSSSVTCLP